MPWVSITRRLARKLAWRFIAVVAARQSRYEVVESRAARRSDSVRLGCGEGVVIIFSIDGRQLCPRSARASAA
jgi:hypothetical protein